MSFIYNPIELLLRKDIFLFLSACPNLARLLNLLLLAAILRFLRSVGDILIILPPRNVKPLTPETLLRL